MYSQEREGALRQQRHSRSALAAARRAAGLTASYGFFHELLLLFSLAVWQHGLQQSALETVSSRVARKGQAIHPFALLEQISEF